MRTAAIGLNFADLFVRSGVYPRTPKPPFVPGMEISGVVEAVGESGSDLRPGQRVVAVPLFGGHAEKVAVQAAWVFPLSDDVDFVEATAMPVAFLTAWYALARAEVSSGDRVVVTPAAGGVGTALLQLISLRGASALALVGSESKFALCRELGAVDAGPLRLSGRAPRPPLPRRCRRRHGRDWRKTLPLSLTPAAVTSSTASPRPPAPAASSA